jgi:ribonuclease-3
MSIWNKFKLFLGSSPFATTRARTDKLQELIGYQFRDMELLRLSLSHRSVTNSADKFQASNERLEFLGDSVLGLVIADQLYRECPHLSEGDLTKRKAMLVNEAALFQAARDTGLNEYVLLSPEEEKAGGRERPSIISDAFESVIGAVYLDGGYDAVRRVILRCLYSRRDSIISDISQHNFKGDLLELVQAENGSMPRYDVISEIGPDHDKTFRVVVSVGGRKLGEGLGSSKKEAEQKAASMALEQLMAQNR